MAKRILWLSQHPPLPRQVKALQRKFGADVEICQDINSFVNAEEIHRRYQSRGYDDLVVVAPYSVLDRLCKLGLRPWWAEMEQVYNRQDAELSIKGRMYKFVCFRRVAGFELKFVPGEEFTD